MPTLVSDGIRNGKQKGPGTDASMITAMRRNRAVLNGLQSEKFARDPFQLAVTGSAGDGQTMTYTFAAQSDIPFDLNDQIIVTGSAPQLVVSAATVSSAASAISMNITAVATPSGGSSVLTVSAPTATVDTVTVTPTLRVGMLFSAGGSGTIFGGLSNSAFYRVSEIISPTQIRVISSNNAGVVGSAFSGTAGSGTLTVTASGYTGNVSGGSVVSLRYVTPVTSPSVVRAFSVGDLITVSGHSVATAGGYNTGTTPVSILSATVQSGSTLRIVYQTNLAGALSSATSTTDVTITHVSPAYNGTFAVSGCTSSTVAVSGPAILTVNSTATITGFRRVRTKPIVDSMNSRGYSVSGVLPFLTARGMNLAFFPTQ